MGHSEYGELWREYMNAFAECLLEMRGDETSAAGQRLVSFLHQRPSRRSLDVKLSTPGTVLHAVCCGCPLYSGLYGRHVRQWLVHTLTKLLVAPSYTDSRWAGPTSRVAPAAAHLGNAVLC